MKKLLRISIIGIMLFSFILIAIAGFKLQSQIESRDMYIDYVNSETAEIVNTLYEFDMREEIMLNEGAIKLLQKIEDLHPLKGDKNAHIN